MGRLGKAGAKSGMARIVTAAGFAIVFLLSVILLKVPFDDRQAVYLELLIFRRYGIVVYLLLQRYVPGDKC